MCVVFFVVCFVVCFLLPAAAGNSVFIVEGESNAAARRRAISIDVKRYY